MSQDGGRFREALLSVTRLWLPLGIAVGGVVLIILGHGKVSDNGDTHTLLAATGVALLVVALIVWIINWMFRMSVASNQDRDREEDARRYYDDHGRWPDE